MASGEGDADIRRTAWQPLEIGDQVRCVKICFPAFSGYHVMLSDLFACWECEAKEEDISELCKAMNATIDAPIRTILQHLQASFTAPTDTKAVFTINTQADFCDLSLTSQLAGFPFKWKFFLTASDSESLAHHMTIPFLMTISELKRQQTELIKLLRDKDAEIENYRMQGVKVTRKNLETNKFDEQKFTKDMSNSKAFELEVSRLGRGAITPVNQELYRDLMTKKADIERDTGEELSVARAWACVDRMSVSVSPRKGPVKMKSPAKPSQTDSETSSEAAERERRKALEAKLVTEEQKLDDKQRKKKKLKL